MVTTFPRIFGRRAIGIYFAAILTANVLFFNHLLPFVWWVFGIIEVTAFFYFLSTFTSSWQKLRPKTFERKIFYTSLIIRVVWVFVAYYFFTAYTGRPFEFDAGDSAAYHDLASDFARQGFGEYNKIFGGFALSDNGYPTYLGIIYMIFGNGLIIPRLLKALYGSFTAVLVYRLASRNFGERTGRIAAVIFMLMPNMIYYTGLHLKETEMVFLTVLLLERVDGLMRSHSFGGTKIVVPLLISVALFFLRTVLGAAALFSVITAVMFLPSKVSGWGKKIMISFWFTLLIAFFLGGQLANEVEEVWSQRDQNQQQALNAMSEMRGGNRYAKYATASIFCPYDICDPFPYCCR